MILRYIEMIAKLSLPSCERELDLTKNGRHASRRTGRRGDFVVARQRLFLDRGTGGFAVHAAGLAFEDRRLAGVFESTSGGVVELYSMLKSQLINS